MCSDAATTHGTVLNFCATKLDSDLTKIQLEITSPTFNQLIERSKIWCCVKMQQKLTSSFQVKPWLHVKQN